MLLYAMMMRGDGYKDGDQMKQREPSHCKARRVAYYDRSVIIGRCSPHTRAAGGASISMTCRARPVNMRGSLHFTRLSMHPRSPLDLFSYCYAYSAPTWTSQNGSHGSQRVSTVIKAVARIVIVDF